MNVVDGVKAAALLFVAAIMQVSIFSQVHILGGGPDVLLVMLVAVALLRGAIVGAAGGFFAGLLVDTASVRPDTVAFTRKVLERSPEATVVFFGPEESTIARGAVAAGARGLIRGGEREDLVASGACEQPKKVICE